MLPQPLEFTLTPLPSAQHSCLKFQPNHRKQLLCEGPGTGRGWQASPNSQIAVTGYDLTSLARSRVSLLSSPECSVGRRATAWAWTRSWQATEQGLARLLPWIISHFGESNPNTLAQS
uniref:LP2570 n=1 Tax=Homo sapiens TaxID=9606 RepID=Q6XYD3_HUMAN|nr:LP2570 [Homo sapiens]